MALRCHSLLFGKLRKAFIAETDAHAFLWNERKPRRIFRPKACRRRHDVIAHGVPSAFSTTSLHDFEDNSVLAQPLDQSGISQDGTRGVDTPAERINGKPT